MINTKFYESEALVLSNISLDTSFVSRLFLLQNNKEVTRMKTGKGVCIYASGTMPCINVVSLYARYMKRVCIVKLIIVKQILGFVIFRRLVKYVSGKRIVG